MTATLPPQVQQYATEFALRKARKHIDAFVRATMPQYTFGWFNELLMAVLMEFIEDYLQGKNPRLMIFAPPRSGKSQLASRHLPAFIMGMLPHLRIIACSYAADLAKRMSNDCKRIIDSPEYREVFPDTVLPGRATKSTDAINSAEFWETVDRDGTRTGGSYRSAGVGGAISGMGFDIGIIDDPVKDYAEASSEAKQKSNAHWYDTTFHSRRDPLKNGIILIMTRWHKEDLGGYLLEKMRKGGEQWKIVCFPMECEEDQESFELGGYRYLTRKKGEILFPERMPPEYVEQCKTGDIAWAALYQQRPTLAGGNFFKTEWLRYWVTPEEAALGSAGVVLPSTWDRMIITGDTAQKTGEQHDYSVFQCWGLREGRLFLLDQIRGKWAAHELKRNARLFWQKHGGGTIGPNVMASAIYIEDKSSGTGLIQDLSEGGFDETTGERWDPLPVVAVPRTKDKVTRAFDKQAYFKSGFIHIPKSAQWVIDYVGEMEDFNLDDTHPHDDQIDPTLDAIDILLKGEGGIDYSGMI